MSLAEVVEGREKSKGIKLLAEQAVRAGTMMKGWLRFYRDKLLITAFVVGPSSNGYMTSNLTQVTDDAVKRRISNRYRAECGKYSQ